MAEHKSLLPDSKLVKNEFNRNKFSQFEVNQTEKEENNANFSIPHQDESYSEGEASDRERLLNSDSEVMISDRSKPTVIRRRVGLISAVALVVGQIIGSGIFISPTIVLKHSGSYGFTLIIWTIGGFLSMLGTLCYCELGTMIEKSGGDYVYLKISYGKLSAFLYSWMNVWLVDPAGLAIRSLTFSLYLTTAFKTGCNDAITLRLLSAIVIIVFATLNCISVSLSAKSQVFFTSAKLIGILMIISIGIMKVVKGETANLHDAFANSISSPGSIGLALYAVMWSYDGWNNLNMITEELKDPDKNFTRAMYISIPLISLCYVFINASFFTVLLPDEMLASNAVAFTFAHKLSPIFGMIMPVIVATSCIGSINSSMFAAPRAMFSMSRENQLPKIFSLVHRRSHTPIPATIFRAVMSLVMLLPATIEPLINCLLFVEWIVYMMMFLAVILLRWRKPHLRRPYKVPVIIPIILIPISLYFIVIPFISRPIQSVVGLTLIFTGIPVYFAVFVKEWVPKKVSRFLKNSSYLAYLLCNVVEPAIPKSFSRY